MTLQFFSFRYTIYFYKKAGTAFSKQVSVPGFCISFSALGFKLSGF